MENIVIGTLLRESLRGEKQKNIVEDEKGIGKRNREETK